MTTDTRSRRGLLLILIASLLWGTVGIATKAIYAVADTDALSIGFFRLAIATPALLAACWHSGVRPTRIPRRDLAFMLMIGVTMALYQVSFLAAIPRIGVAISVLVTLCTAPVIVALLEAALLREPITARVALALLAGLGGTLLLGWPESTGATDSHATLVGLGLALASAFGYSIMTLCSRALAGRYHPLQPMTIGLGTGALLLLPFALASGVNVSYSASGWALLLYLGLVPTAVAFVVFLTGIRHATATVASIVTLAEPLTATIFAWLLFGEQLGGWGLLGALCLLGAIALLFGGNAPSATAETPEPMALETHGQ